MRCFFSITGGAGNDTITSKGEDTIDGGTGADSIISGGGADTITGGLGADSINAGAAVDTFITANVSTLPT